ncbi:MAG: PAS domain-containing sensor histidine kinase [Methanobacteriota archaeon]
MSELKEKYKILIIVILLAIASFLTYYFLAVLRIALVFTHFFYIPIILAALWWKRKGMVVAVFLVVLLLLSNIFIKNVAPTYDDVIRAFMFMVIAFLVVVLSEEIEKRDEELKKHQEHLEDMVKERTAELRDTNKQLQLESTEHKLAEEKLKDSLKNWQNTFHAISDSVFILDSHGLILQSNGVFEHMLGTNTEAIIGQNCYKAIHKTSDFIEGCPFEQMKQTGMRESFEFEDKEHGLWFQVTIDPVCNESGKIINVVHIMRDVTEFKKAEETRYENIQLVLANKAKSDFLAHMSHELRTPLSSIIGFSELLNQKTIGELNEKQEHYIDNVLESSKHLLALINDILDLSKVEAGKIELVIEKISVPEAISESVTLIKERAMKHSVVIKKDIDPQLEIEADRQRIKQMLFNLLSNAVKFSKPEGGTVTITAKKEDDMTKISISDTGIGIREENIRKLFTEFEQLDQGISRKYEGTGLGLAITKKLVELHGGKIWAESKYGEGSTFTFYLPVHAKNKEVMT